MRLDKYSQNKITGIIIERLADFNKRERIVISMPFGCKCKRVELYCGETAPKGTTGLGEAISGPPFPGIVTLSVYNDYDNVVNEKGSYTYKRELMHYIPKLIAKLWAEALPQSKAMRELQEKEEQRAPTLKYLASPNHCPHCNSDNIEAGPIQHDDVLNATVTCNSCEKEWVDYYTLTSVDLTNTIVNS